MKSLHQPAPAAWAQSTSDATRAWIGIVAIKVISDLVSGTPEMRQRFEREARTLSALNHPHICTLYDVGRHDELELLGLEYVEGETLAARLARGGLTLDEVIRRGMELADARDRAHRAGIIHRDLKPANIMLTRSGRQGAGLRLGAAGRARTAGRRRGDHQGRQRPDG